MTPDKTTAGAMDDAKLADLIGDMQAEPDWRSNADLACAYYDGDQHTAAMIAKARALGMPLAKANFIKRMVNVLMGNEARNRASWKVDSDMDSEKDVAASIQAKLTPAQRETMADFAISEAYAGMVKAGIGWVETSRVSDIWAPYQYRVQSVHRDEIFWDWRARMIDLSDRRWLIRTRWMDLDEAEANMPRHRDLLRVACGVNGPAELLGQTLIQHQSLQAAYSRQNGWSVHSSDWQDTARARLRFFEVWYFVTRPATAIMREDRRPVEFDPKNPTHSIWLAQGAKLVKAPRRVLRRALFAGPHRLSDTETQRRRDPYTPFIAYRKDKDRSPYGPVLDMIYPQDEYNARRGKLMWLLQQAQIFIDNDALDTTRNSVADVKRNAMRADALFVMNANRKNGKDAIHVRRDINMPTEQYEAMQDAKNLIQELAGVYGPMLGEKGGAVSGVAINSLADQSTMSNADMNDNYVMGRRLVGEALVDLIIEDSKRENMQVKVGVGSSERIVVLNTKDEAGNPINTVDDASIKVAVDDAPNTVAYRLQQQNQLGQILQTAGTNPQAAAILLPSYIETASYPNAKHDAKLLRQAAGIPEPGDEKAMEAGKAQAEALNAKAAEANTAEEASRAELQAAKARLENAKATDLEAKLSGQHPDQLLAANTQAQQTAAAAPDPKAAALSELLDGVFAE